jgi:hypothetical protein
MSGGSYNTGNNGSPYVRQQIENQNIKDLSFWNNNDERSSEEPEWAERQSPMPFILGIIILVVASTVLWFLFRWASGESTNSPPIIAADTAPFKVRPENPGGMLIPHQNLSIYGRISQNTPQPVERLLPPPEQPMIAPPPHMQTQQLSPNQMIASPMGHQPQADMQQTNQHPSAMPSNPPMMSSQQPANQPYPQTQGYTAPQQNYGSSPMMQPNVPPQPNMQSPQTQAYQPSSVQAPYPQQGYNSQAAYPTQTQPASPYPAAPQAPLQAAANSKQAAAQPTPSKQLSPIEDIKPASSEDEADDEMTDGQNELDKLLASDVEASSKMQQKKSEKNSPKSNAVDRSKYKVQIASLPSRAMAEREMKRLRSNHHNVFQNKPWDIQRINLGGDRGTTHRLVVGSFPNQAAASKFCKKLRHDKIGCMVIAPVSE